MKDYLIIFTNVIKYNYLKNSNINLQSWLDKSNLSKNAKYAIRIFSITICDIPEKTNINDFFSMFTYNSTKKNLQQFTEPDKWHNIIEQKLLNKNVNIYKNCEVVKINILNNIPVGVTYLNLNYNISR